MSDLAALLDQVVDIAVDAGTRIMGIYNHDFSVTEKADKSPLTEADEAAHALIAKRLSMVAPRMPILSEEDVHAFGGPDDEGRYWLVDPLDGTKEFIKRNGEFTVNIALISQGRPVLGVVHAPALDVTYLAAVGAGAFKQVGTEPRIRITVAEHKLGTPWRVVGSRSHAGYLLDEFLKSIGECELVPMGSSLKLCLVAEGCADLYPRLGPTSLWDTAAAQCVVEQSNGVVLSGDGIHLSYAEPTRLLNPCFIVAGLRSSVGVIASFSSLALQETGQ